MITYHIFDDIRGWTNKHYIVFAFTTVKLKPYLLHTTNTTNYMRRSEEAFRTL